MKEMCLIPCSSSVSKKKFKEVSFTWVISICLLFYNRENSVVVMMNAGLLKCVNSVLLDVTGWTWITLIVVAGTSNICTLSHH